MCAKKLWALTSSFCPANVRLLRTDDAWEKFNGRFHNICGYQGQVALKKKHRPVACLAAVQLLALYANGDALVPPFQSPLVIKLINNLLQVCKALGLQAHRR